MTIYSILTTTFAVIIALCGMPTVIVVNGQDVTTTCTPITDILCNDEDNNYSTKAVCEAIKISELDDDLNEETWTIFAPNDKAFEKLGRQNLDYLVFNTSDTVPLVDLLLFHVIPGIGLSANELPCVAGSNLIEMANGEDSRTLCRRKDTPYAQKGRYNTDDALPNIISANIQACNGVVSLITVTAVFRMLCFFCLFVHGRKISLESNVNQSFIFYIPYCARKNYNYNSHFFVFRFVFLCFVSFPSLINITNHKFIQS